MGLDDVKARLGYFAALTSLRFAMHCNMSLSPKDRRWLAFRLMNDRFHPRTRNLAELLGYCTLTWKNHEFSIRENGEARLLERLAPFDPQVVIDVGANVGDWSVVALQCFSRAVVHAFEISAGTAATLSRNAAAFGERLIVNEMGLADHEGTVPVYCVSEESELTSTFRDALTVDSSGGARRDIHEMTAQVTTGDSYLRRQGIETVDFLKIDVEGAEMSVLNGFAEAFARQSIDLVQFEYGTLNLVSKVILADYHRFFERHGFLVGKLYPEGVAFKSYDVSDDDFVGPNYVACHSKRTDLIEAIRC